MVNNAALAEFYRTTGLLQAILCGLRDAGVTKPSVDDLSTVDEFHVGGTAATKFVAEALRLQPNERILDIGSGLGGPARLIAQAYACRVVGVELAADFAQAGHQLNTLTGLDGAVSLLIGNALHLPFDSGHFDAAFMIHVGMNIEDKSALMTSIYHVLRPGGRLVVYDILKTQDSPLTYPLPWAGSAQDCAAENAAAYLRAFDDAGFTVTSQLDKRDFALNFFANVKADRKRNQSSPLDLRLVMGPRTNEKIRNIQEQITNNLLKPTLFEAIK